MMPSAILDDGLYRLKALNTLLGIAKISNEEKRS